MKKDMTRKNDKDKIFWEEFVLKNSIKKKFQTIEALVLMT